MSRFWLIFVLFSITIQIEIEKSVDGKRTQGRRIVGASGSTELAQLTESLLPATEDLGSSPVECNFELRINRLVTVFKLSTLVIF